MDKKKVTKKQEVKKKIVEFVIEISIQPTLIDKGRRIENCSKGE